MTRWKAGPERPKTKWCWDCSRPFQGRVFARIIGEDGNEHDVHKACINGHKVILASTTVRP